MPRGTGAEEKEDVYVQTEHDPRCRLRLDPREAFEDLEAIRDALNAD